jgi:hypothetical protein
LENGFALIAMMINHACGGDQPMTSYMPHYVEPPITIAEAMKKWE